MRFAPCVTVAFLSLLAMSGTPGCAKDSTPDAPAGPECGYHEDCGEGGVCFNGECKGSRFCRERSDCALTPVCEGQRCICPPEVLTCLPVCVTDNSCPADGHCVDGVCTRYPVNFDGVVPGGDARGALQVGIARVELDTPVGVSMAGYGMRRGPQTPYRDSLGGSNSWFDKPDVQAIAFDDGKEMFILVRVPACWSTDFMVADTARKVQERIGMNVLDNIVTSSPHSHSHPARFWHMVVGKYFGVFGYDEFDFEIFDRMTTSLADAVVMALDDRQPARFGYEVIEDFDPESRINRDRRSQNNGLAGYTGKDRRMVVMRVDDMDGNPRAVLTHFGMHGTVFGENSPILSGDAGGGVEVEVARLASQKYGQSVLSMYVQGNGGDISPAGDDRNHPGLERLQLIGRRVWERIDPVIDAIETRADTKVSIVGGRIPISHSILGYGEEEFFDETTQCEDSPDYFRFGAFQCVEGVPGDDSDPNTAYVDGDLDCVFAVECLTGGHAVPQFQKTRLTVVQLGGLTMATMPGEPLSQFGRDLVARINEAVPSGDDALILGYSQDHHFYLMNEPDWFQGGYEPSRDIWGWRLAPYLADQSVELAKELMREPEGRVVDNGNLKPMYWDIEAERRERVTPTDTDGAPDAIITNVPSTVRRMDVATFAWAGGHPGVDRPRIVLEQESAGAWSEVQRAGGGVYDDSRFEMLVHYDGDCNRSNCQNHRWRVQWEERRDFPLGRYRLRVEGRAQTDGEQVDYTVLSDAFDLISTDRLRVYDVRASATGFEARVVDPPGVEMVPNGDGFEARPNGHLLRSQLVPSRFGAPLPIDGQLTVSGAVTAPGGRTEALATTTGVEMVTENRAWVSGLDAMGVPTTQNVGELPTTRLSVESDLAAAGAVVTLTVTDAHGNSGTVTATIAP